MTNTNTPEIPRMLCLVRVRSSVMIACLMFVSVAEAQHQSPRARVEALDLESMTVGRVTTLFAPNDRSRARQLAELSEAAAAFFEQKLGVSFAFRLAVLGPKDWFSPYGAGLPYGIPWCSVAERLMVVPASLKEGALIDGRNAQEDRWRVDFVTLHEFGHLTAKQYLHPTSAHDELPVLWFEELTATYFAYGFIRSIDQHWAESARAEWIARVKAYTPRQLSLDWSFMRTLPADELGPTYGWYQNVLNLRVADVYAKHGLAFLRTLKQNLPLNTMDNWTTQSLLASLEQISPGFQEWADELQKGVKGVRKN